MTTRKNARRQSNAPASGILATSGTALVPAPGQRADFSRIRIMPVRGINMEPELSVGNQVTVDIEDRAPTPPGIFAVWDGLGLTLNYVEVIPNSQPVRVRISSAHPAFKPYERTLGGAGINGRVIGVWKRL